MFLRALRPAIFNVYSTKLCVHPMYVRLLFEILPVDIIDEISIFKCISSLVAMETRAIVVRTCSRRENVMIVNEKDLKMESELTISSTDHWTGDGNVTAHL